MNLFVFVGYIFLYLLNMLYVFLKHGELETCICLIGTICNLRNRVHWFDGGVLYL